MLQIKCSEGTWKVAVETIAFMCSVIQTNLGQVSISPNLIRETTRTGRTCASISGILCYLDYLKNVFIQNKGIFDKYESYIIFLYYIIFYCINIILFYFFNF